MSSRTKTADFFSSLTARYRNLETTLLLNFLRSRGQDFKSWHLGPIKLVKTDSRSNFHVWSTNKLRLLGLGSSFSSCCSPLSSSCSSLPSSSSLSPSRSSLYSFGQILEAPLQLCWTCCSPTPPCRSWSWPPLSSCNWCCSGRCWCCTWWGWWLFMWVFRLVCCVKRFPQSEHGNLYLSSSGKWTT